MSGKHVEFKTELTRTGTNTTGIIVPPDVIAELEGGGRPPVVVTVNGYRYRTTVGVMRGTAMLPFSAANRAASGIAGGDAIAVKLQLDSEPRTAKIPDDLAKAIAEAGLTETFCKQAPSRQRADADNVTSAKAFETRARRIMAIVDRLRTA
jgi:hypothetical protein